MLSMTTDYANVHADDCPEPYLRHIAEAGYSHVHWCHQWLGDFVYSDAEIEQIGLWLKEFGLGVTDIHGSAGQQKAWMALEEYRRLAGVELVENRIQMAARLGTDVVIMHLPPHMNAEEKGPQWDQARKTLDELEPCARRCGVRIALENGDFDLIERLLGLYAEDYIGLCYDCGHGNHGNMSGSGLDRLEAGMKDRVISVHLHDNDGVSDLHDIPFRGTVDWPRLACLIAESSYRKWVNLETLMMSTDIEDEDEFLALCYKAGTDFAEMIARCKSGEDS